MIINKILRKIGKIENLQGVKIGLCTPVYDQLLREMERLADAPEGCLHSIDEIEGVPIIENNFIDADRILILRGPAVTDIVKLRKKKRKK